MCMYTLVVAVSFMSMESDVTSINALVPIVVSVKSIRNNLMRVVSVAHELRQDVATKAVYIDTSHIFINVFFRL